MVDFSRSDLVAGVVGTGTMGRGIAQVLAQCGARTLVYDAQAGAAEKARQSIGEALRRMAEKGRLADPEGVLRRVEIVSSPDALAPCHVVVEAIVEDLAAKRALFGGLEKVVREDCILASNTSSLSVTAMAAACKRPGRVAGYHFFNPVPVMKIVEVVDGVLTEPWVGEALVGLAKRFGDRLARLRGRARLRVVEERARAALGEHLRDAAAHGAGADDAGNEFASGKVHHRGEGYCSRGRWL